MHVCLYIYFCMCPFVCMYIRDEDPDSQEDDHLEAAEIVSCHIFPSAYETASCHIFPSAYETASCYIFPSAYKTASSYIFP